MSNIILSFSRKVMHNNKKTLIEINYNGSKYGETDAFKLNKHDGEIDISDKIMMVNN